MQHRALAAKTVVAVKFFVPKLAPHPGLLSRALRGWEQRAPSQPYIPCPQDLALEIAFQFFLENRLEMAVAIILSHECYLRATESRSLKRKQLIIHPASSRPPFAAILLSETKSNKSQSVTVRSLFVFSLLHRLFSLRNPQPDDNLFSFSHESFRLPLNFIVSSPNKLNLQDVHITPHSLRYGGATHDHISGRLPM